MPSKQLLLNRHGYYNDSSVIPCALLKDVCNYCYMVEFLLFCNLLHVFRLYARHQLFVCYYIRFHYYQTLKYLKIIR